MWKRRWAWEGRKEHEEEGKSMRRKGRAWGGREEHEEKGKSMRRKERAWEEKKDHQKEGKRMSGKGREWEEEDAEQRRAWDRRPTCQWNISSPTGPALHCAGGSRPKSWSSFVMRFRAIVFSFFDCCSSCLHLQRFRNAFTRLLTFLQLIPSSFLEPRPLLLDGRASIHLKCTSYSEFNSYWVIEIFFLQIWLGY